MLALVKNPYAYFLKIGFAFAFVQCTECIITTQMRIIITGLVWSNNCGLLDYLQKTD